ncbi:MAG: sigma-70 family RNA polymerase sigma factor [Planctomycetota bacterium]|nr:sigma-70 family RNA polymerase sigma factor [Planctomycetota bacterium]|tara:strand:+ start:1051 stop:1677 length:627 start_codon:yes stop_codon:yes gene_type:complete
MLAEDREYVERVLAGEPEVFEQLVRKYNRLGGAIAYGVLSDFHLAEDVVQDAFIRAFEALDSLKEPDRFRAWFAGIVKRRSIDVLRQRKNPRIRAASLEAGGADAEEGGSLGSTVSSDSRRPGQSPDDSQLDAAVHAERRRQVLECISGLDENDRIIVSLKHMEGLSYREIAELMETSVSAVESRLFRARRVLRKKLAAVLKLDSPES